MSEGWRSELTGTSPLWMLVGIAVVLTIVRQPNATHAERVALANMFALGIAAQCLHLLEEYLTSFYIRWPETAGVVPWTQEFFMTFNVTWIAIWSASVAGILAGWRIAYVPAWFFALGMVGNALWHPALALMTGGYFPGLWTSPFVGAIGFWLLRRLATLTRPLETQVSSR